MRKTPPDILITTPESLYLMLSSRRPRDPRRRRGGDRRRDPRRRPVQARLPPGADAGAARSPGAGLGGGLAEQHGEAPQPPPSPASSGSGSRRPSGRWSGSRSSSSARSASARSSMRGGEGARPGDRRPGRGHDRTGRAQLPERGRRSRPRASRSPTSARSGPRSTRAAEAGPRAHLDDHLRQHPPRRRAPGQAPERARSDEPPSRSSRRPSTRATRARGLGIRRGTLGDRTRGQQPWSLVEIARAHHGSLVPRGADGGRGDAEVGAAALPGRDLLAGAGDRHGRRRPGDPGRVAEVGQPRPAAGRPRRPLARRGLARPHLPQVPRRPARVRGRRQADARRARSRRR